MSGIEHGAARPPSRVQIVAAFAAVYLIWGSTYLAIRFAIETIPPFFMASIRFLIAGAALYAWTRARGAPRPTRAQWRAAFVVGGLMLVGGNGAVVWAEQHVPSGIASLLVAMVPLWMVLLDWLRPRGIRPRVIVMLGVALGLGGVALLVHPGSFIAGSAVDPIGAGVLVVGSLSWAAGSLYSRHAHLPAIPLLAAAMEIVAGGVLLAILGALSGEAHHVALAAISLRSALSVLYLVTFGSLVGFTAYVWLLRVVNPTHVATYAYVNPVVAVLLGWAVAGEPLTPRTLAAATVIVGAVALITAGQSASANASRSIARYRLRNRIFLRRVSLDEPRDKPLLPPLENFVDGRDHEQRQ